MPLTIACAISVRVAESLSRSVSSRPDTKPLPPSPQTSWYEPEHKSDRGVKRDRAVMGFRFQLVLADSLYGESRSNFICVLESLKLPYIVAIASNHGVWMPQEEVTAEPWQAFTHT